MTTTKTSHSEELRQPTQKQIVNLDCDGVIADFAASYIRCINTALDWSIPLHWQPSTADIARELGLSKEQTEMADALMSAPGMAAQFLAYPEAVDGVKKLASFAEVYFVTSPFRKSPTWDYDRRSWLTQHFGKELGSRVIFTHDKYLNYADVFVDDKPENCHEFKAHWPFSDTFRWALPSTQLVPGLAHLGSWAVLQQHVSGRAAAGKAVLHPWAGLVR